jgi:LysM repeat protein
VPPETLASWVRVSVNNGDMGMTIDESGFPEYLESLQGQLTDGRTVWLPPDAYDLTGRWQRGQPYTVILRHPPTSYTVEPGDTLLRISYRLNIPAWMILRENPGMDPDSIPAGAVLAIPSKSDLLPLPVVVGKRIIISISEQRMYIYENGSQIRDYVISTGIDRSPTQPGVFQVQTHVLEAYASVWDLYMPNFIGIYEAWPGFMNGIHGLPTLSSGQRLWAGNLGRPVSYGCIILSLEGAQWLYDWAESGVVVEIKG